VYEYVKERFEQRGYVLCRIGKAPKFAVPFQTDVPFGKFDMKLVPPVGEKAQFEFLCDGQQFRLRGLSPRSSPSS
jgi:hypothetical protein